jgi:hypothetical protein
MEGVAYLIVGELGHGYLLFSNEATNNVATVRMIYRVDVAAIGLKPPHRAGECILILTQRRRSNPKPYFSCARNPKVGAELIFGCACCVGGAHAQHRLDTKDRAIRADQTLYLVVDRFGRHGSVYHETEVERTDPLRHRSQDVPESIRDFVDKYTGPDRQLALRRA